MSTHPNVMLIARLSPNDLPRKTFLEILKDAGSDAGDPRVKIGDDEYNALLMNGDYHDGFQIAAAAGEIVLMDMATYGYGEAIGWDKLREKHDALSAWLVANHERYRLASSQISVGANYW